MNLSRRSLLRAGLFAAAAPMIVRVASLMPVRMIHFTFNTEAAYHVIFPGGLVFLSETQVGHLYSGPGLP